MQDPKADQIISECHVGPESYDDREETTAYLLPKAFDQSGASYRKVSIMGGL